MFYDNTVQSTRALFFSSWEKYRKKEPLLPLEKQIVDVILSHPEYHVVLENKQNNVDNTYFPENGETNPFLHMGLHLAIRDQVSTDRPQGITAAYQQLIIKYGSQINAEHVMMERLVECLWQAQRNHSLPDEARYLQACNELV